MSLPAMTMRKPRCVDFFCCALALLGLLGSYGGLALSADAVAGYPVVARWLARFVSLLVYAAVCMLVLRGGSLLALRGVGAACGTSLVAGVVLTLVCSGSLLAYVVGQALVGLGSAWTLMAWGEMLASDPPSERHAHVISGALGATALILAYRLLPDAAARVLYVATVAGTVVPVRLVGRTGTAPSVGAVAAEARDARGCPRAISRVLSAVSWELVLLMACYALLFRVLQNFTLAGGVAASLIRFAVTMAVLLALRAYLRRHDGRRSDGIVLFLFVLAGTSLALIPFADDRLRTVASSVAASCWPLFYYLLWMLLFDLGDAGEVGALPAFVSGWFALNVELILAAPVAYALAQQVGLGTLSMTALVIILLYTLLVASLLIRRRREPQAQAVAEGAVESMEARCERHAARSGLTRRETETFVLLARGRSAPFIADKLGISLSTAKGHVRHVYEKLGVSSKQGLIDLVQPDGDDGTHEAG